MNYNGIATSTLAAPPMRRDLIDQTSVINYDQKINFATAACICKAFLKRSDDEINTCRLIGWFLIPVRPGRSAPRKLKPQSAKTFLYRAA